MDSRPPPLPVPSEHSSGRAPGLAARNKWVDKRKAPLMRPLVQAEYVGNFVAYSRIPGMAGKAALGVAAKRKKMGLRAHLVETSRGGDTLGWLFSCEEPVVAAKPQRTLRLRSVLCQAWCRRPAC